MTPATLKPWRALSLGNSAEVWLARDHEGGLGLVKRLRPALRGDAEARAAFIAEATLHAAVDHPHIVRAFGHGVDADGPWLTLEYVDGVSAAVLIARGTTLSSAAVAAVGSDVASALAALHSGVAARGHRDAVVHRDLSPANLVHDVNGTTKLTDFGAARRLDGTTISRTIVGDVGYQAPEVCAGDSAGPESDVYALGVILFELATGGLPVRASSPAAIVAATIAGEVIDPAVAVPPLAPWLATVLRGVLQRHGADRPSAAALAADLGAHVDPAARTELMSQVVAGPDALDATETRPRR